MTSGICPVYKAVHKMWTLDITVFFEVLRVGLTLYLASLWSPLGVRCVLYRIIKGENLNQSPNWCFMHSSHSLNISFLPFLKWSSTISPIRETQNEFYISFILIAFLYASFFLFFISFCPHFKPSMKAGERHG